MVLLLISLLLPVAYVAACDIPVAYAAVVVDPAITDNTYMDPQSQIYINALRIRNIRFRQSSIIRNAIRNAQFCIT
jgi:hypothetical protein